MGEEKVKVEKDSDEMLVSVIVPAYNVEKYIDKCMRTLLGQTYRNIEIILIDDGSTDNTPRICDEYAKRDNRIKVYHQENKGQADARNFALTVARGSHIVYADSDDYLSLNCIEKLVWLSQKYNADIVQCCAQKFWEDGKKEKIELDGMDVKVYTASEALKEFCYQRKFYAGPWAKLIQRELMEGLQFPVNTGYEDMAIMFHLIGKAKKIVLLPEVMYFYRQHYASTMHTKFSDKKVDRIRLAEELKEYIETYYPENTQAVKTRYLLANLQLLMDLPYDKAHMALRNQVRENIHSVRLDVIMDKESKKSIRLMAATSYLGIHVLMRLGRLYKKVFS